MTKDRLDLLLVSRGLADTRQKAQALILTGDVLVNDVPVDKPGSKVPLDAAIRLRGSTSQFVGRGGDKISSAFDSFQISLEGIIALDVGASTGGFTDCMLQRGAKKVYAVDVGYNQLVDSLRRDERVVVMEKMNARYLDPSDFPIKPVLATVDVSFISVRKLLEPILSVLARPASLLILVKPQFELEPEYVGKGGVVKDPKHEQLAVQLVSDAAQSLGCNICAAVPSALKGNKKGNQEHFLFLSVN